MEWTEVKDKKDIDYLMKEYCAFHDSCLVELNYKSGTFVDNEGSMALGAADDRELYMIFQSQCIKNVLELCFNGVKSFHVAGWQEHYLCDIFNCTLDIRNDLVEGKDDNLIIWADYEGFNPKEGATGNALSEPMSTYVIARNLKWRYTK